jgi:hypothetical protein
MKKLECFHPSDILTLSFSSYTWLCIKQTYVITVRFRNHLSYSLVDFSPVLFSTVRIIFFIHIIFLIFCSCAIVMSFFSRINCSFQIILLLLQLLLLFYIFLTGLLFLFACIFKYFVKYLENLICLSLRIRYYKVNQKFYLCTWQKLSACLKIIF